MAKKLVVYKCSECPYSKLLYGGLFCKKTKEEIYLNESRTSGINKVLDCVKIPEWCPLEED